MSLHAYNCAMVQKGEIGTNTKQVLAKKHITKKCRNNSFIMKVFYHNKINDRKLPHAVAILAGRDETRRVGTRGFRVKST